MVIDIDDNIYKRAMVYKGEQFPDNNDLLSALITAVTNGVPLQKRKMIDSTPTIIGADKGGREQEK